MKLIVQVFFFIIFLLITSVTRVHANYGDILFLDDFSDGNADGWLPVHEIGPNTNSSWEVVDGKYGLKVTSPSTVGNSIAGDSNWTNIRYEFDMLALSGVDKNFIWRVVPTNESSLGYYFYQLHVSGNTIYLTKHAPSNVGPPIFYHSLPYILLNNITYNWKLDLIEGNFKIYVKEANQQDYTLVFDVTDSNLPVLNGAIGFRVGTGGGGTTEVYFDNIKVTDLTPDPTPTQFPYFSQRDPLWKDSKYDHLNRTIEQVGCALTSAAMVLKSYGLDKIPWGDQLVDLTPQTLNDWLNVYPFPYWREGSVNWSSISTLTQALNASNSAYPQLELQLVSPTDTPSYNNILENLNQPIITGFTSPSSSSGRHFVTAYKTEATDSGSLYRIHDPFYGADSVLGVPTTNIQRALHYYPAGTDLNSGSFNSLFQTSSLMSESLVNPDFSYVWLNADPNLNITITNPDNQLATTQPVSTNIPLSQLILEKPLVDEIIGETVGNAYWQLGIKYPIGGNYQLQLSAPVPGYYSFEIYMYNASGELTAQENSVFIGSSPIIFNLNYNPNNTTQHISKQVSFETLKQLIQDVYNQGWVKNFGLKNSLYTQVGVIETQDLKRPDKTIRSLDSLNEKIIKLAGAGVIHASAQDLLNQEIRLLIDSLNQI